MVAVGGGRRLLACWPNRSLSVLVAIAGRAGQKRARLQVQAICNKFSRLFKREETVNMNRAAGD
jgi:hypothetical protein